MSSDFERKPRRDPPRALPEPPPDEAGRAATAGRGTQLSRRRTGGLVAVGAVTVVVTALVVVPIVIGENNRGGSAVTEIDETPDDPTGPEPGPSGYECPGPGQVPPLFAPSAELPGGAVLARICPSGPEGWTPPVDALETGLDELVVEVNAAEPVTGDLDCPAGRGAGFTLTFQYDDGNTFAVRGSLGGCATITVGGAERLGAEELVQAYAELLVQQRAERDPPPEAAVNPLCAQRADARGWSTILPLSSTSELSHVVLCGYGQRSQELEQSWALTDDQVALLSEDLTRRTFDQVPAGCEHSGPVYVLRGVTSWGDPLELVGGCGYDYFSHPDHSAWDPSPAAAAMLDSLLR